MLGFCYKSFAYWRTKSSIGGELRTRGPFRRASLIFVRWLASARNPLLPIVGLTLPGVKICLFTPAHAFVSIRIRNLTQCIHPQVFPRRCQVLRNDQRSSPWSRIRCSCSSENLCHFPLRTLTSLIIVT